jgi:hypothetical protein
MWNSLKFCEVNKGWDGFDRVERVRARKTKAGSFDCVTRDETGSVSAQDDTSVLVLMNFEPASPWLAARDLVTP